MKRIDYSKQFKGETPIHFKVSISMHHYITYECFTHNVYK